MSIQDALSRKLSPIKRKLFDYKIRLSGNRSKIIRLKTTENKYGDEDITIVSDCQIIAIRNYPSEIRLYRLRTEVQIPISESTGIYFYDILPIEVFTQWKDNVEVGDILVRKIRDENYCTDPLLNIIRITEVLGAFTDELAWKKSQASPHTMKMTTQLQLLIDNY